VVPCGACSCPILYCWPGSAAGMVPAQHATSVDEAPVLEAISCALSGVRQVSRSISTRAARWKPGPRPVCWPMSHSQDARASWPSPSSVVAGVGKLVRGDVGPPGSGPSRPDGSPVRVCRGFRSLRPKTACPAGASKPGKPGPAARLEEPPPTPQLRRRQDRDPRTHSECLVRVGRLNGELITQGSPS